MPSEADPLVLVLCLRLRDAPALDATSLKNPGVPGKRVYTAVNVVNDQEVGQRSPALSIVAGI